ncbi:hypothetical protein DPMN_176580 [Dreissena polymorpha]|uniref:Uncharacterized protein n=1 Tax=Dreissena polymorpha TaxID=45954 RepID=A0A9D4EAE7_DREPO|nr:hypothetical protein DPMN_176580 [Dreissena polymorpha]
MLLGCTTLQGRSFAIELCATNCERQDYVPTDPTLGCCFHNATAMKGLNWTILHQRWTSADWNDVLFTD